MTGKQDRTLRTFRGLLGSGYCPVLTPLAVWMFLITAYLSGGNGLSPDSASYIECAQSIESGRGFQVRPFASLEPRLWQPLDCFPPGYPLLTAGLMRLGVNDAYCAARAVAVGSSFLFLLLALGFYARMLPAGVAALAGIVLVCTPPMLIYETMCLSEAPYMLLATISLFSLLTDASPASPRNLRWIFVAGLVGGCAWCVRNVGVALFAASLVYLGSQMPRLRVRGLVAAVGAWLVGWFSGCGWLIARNLRTFGTVGPYRMPSRELPIGLTAAVAAAAIVAIMIATLVARRRWLDFARERPADCLLGGFLLLHVVVVIMAHCVYRMGEAVESFRFYAPVYWIGAWFLVRGARRLFERAPLRPRPVGAIVAAAVIVCGASEAARPLWPEVWSWRGTVVAAKQSRPDRAEVARLGREIPKDELVLADCVEELRAFGDVNARRVPDLRYGQAPLTWSEINQAGEDGRLWGIVVWDGNRFAEGRCGSALRDLVRIPEAFPQLRKLETGGAISVWKFVR